MDSLELFLGKGDGTFQPPVTVAGTGAFDITAADFDGDGHLDLATTDQYTGRVLFGDGHGNFSAPQTFPTATTRSASRRAISTVMGAPS